MILLPVLIVNQLQAQCTPSFTFDPDACPVTDFSARLESTIREGINPDPTRVISSANQVQPNTRYLLYLFRDNPVNENVIACIGNTTGFRPESVEPFCPDCNDLGTFTYFIIVTNSNYTPSIGIAFDVYPACSQDKSCGSTYCGSPYETELAERDKVTIRIF